MADWHRPPPAMRFWAVEEASPTIMEVCICVCVCVCVCVMKGAHAPLPQAHPPQLQKRWVKDTTSSLGVDTLKIYFSVVQL